MPHSSTYRQPVNAKTFLGKFLECFKKILKDMSPHNKAEMRTMLMIPGVTSLVFIPVTLLVKNSNGDYLIVAKPVLGSLLVLAVITCTVAIVAVLAIISGAVIALYDTTSIVVEPAYHRYARLRLSYKELRTIRKGGLTLENTPSMRATLDDSFHQVRSTSVKQGVVMRLLRTRLSKKAETYRAELFAWLESDESFEQAVHILRRLTCRSTHSTGPLGPIDTVWIFDGSPGSEVTLRIMQKYIAGTTVSNGRVAVCTPLEIHKNLLRSYDSGLAAEYSTRRYPPFGAQTVSVRIGRESAFLNGADPQTVMSIYNSSTDSPFANLEELVAAAKLL